MRRAASVVAVALAVAAPLPGSADDSCAYDPELVRFVCVASGVIPGPPAPAPGVPPPLRYVHTATDPVVGPCHFWSSIPGGLDAWDSANDPAVLATVSSLPLCPGSPVPPEVEDRAWQIFRAFPLAPPLPGMEPPDGGVTGLPTHLSAALPAPITHAEPLPDGRTLAVRATVTLITVDWGDGAVTGHDPAAARPYPDGAVTHTYLLKTCPAQYRAEHPRGDGCHPHLDAYPISATFTWVGEWTVGGVWQVLDSVDLTAETTYDVDEVIGVLQP